MWKAVRPHAPTLHPIGFINSGGCDWFWVASPTDPQLWRGGGGIRVWCRITALAVTQRTSLFWDVWGCAGIRCPVFSTLSALRTQNLHTWFVPVRWSRWDQHHVASQKKICSFLWHKRPSEELHNHLLSLYLYIHGQNSACGFNPVYFLFLNWGLKEKSTASWMFNTSWSWRLLQKPVKVHKITIAACVKPLYVLKRRKVLILLLLYV